MKINNVYVRRIDISLEDVTTIGRPRDFTIVGAVALGFGLIDTGGRADIEIRLTSAEVADLTRLIDGIRARLAET